MQLKESQSPFGFWGDWNHFSFDIYHDSDELSQSPFGFWGDWNWKRMF